MNKSKYGGKANKRTTRKRNNGGNSGPIVAWGHVVNERKVKSNIWHSQQGYNHSTKDKDAFLHPAIFPESLAHDHIISWSNEGDTVLDPFLGSGTTGKMAVLLNRNFVGCDISKEYVEEIARPRIEAAYQTRMAQEASSAGKVIYTDKERETGQLPLFQEACQ